MPIALLRFFQGSVIGLLLSWVADLAGFDMSGLQVLGGSVGFGLGLSLQIAVSDYVSGFVLLWDRSIRVGEWALLPDAHDHRGCFCTLWTTLG